MKRKDAIYTMQGYFFAFLLCSSCTGVQLGRVPILFPSDFMWASALAAVDAFDASPVCIRLRFFIRLFAQVWDGVPLPVKSLLTPVRYYPEDGSSLSLRGYYPPSLWRPMVRWRIL